MHRIGLIEQRRLIIREILHHQVGPCCLKFNVREDPLETLRLHAVLRNRLQLSPICGLGQRVRLSRITQSHDHHVRLPVRCSSSVTEMDDDDKKGNKKLVILRVGIERLSLVTCDCDSTASNGVMGQWGKRTERIDHNTPLSIGIWLGWLVKKLVRSALFGASFSPSMLRFLTSQACGWSRRRKERSGVPLSSYSC